MAEDLERDLERILETGITNTGHVIDLLKEKGWKDNDILPVIYQTLLQGRVDPKGAKTPYKGN